MLFRTTATGLGTRDGMLHWFTSEFIDPTVEDRYRVWRYNAALTQYRVVGWLLIVAAFPFIMQIWRVWGPVPEFYLVASLRLVQVAFTALMLVWSYQRKPYRWLDAGSALCLFSMVTVNLAAMTNANITSVMMFLQVLLITAFAYILFPGRLIHAVIPLTVFTTGFSAALIWFLPISDLMRPGLIAWAVLANIVGYLAARQFAIFRRREYLAVLDAESKAQDLEQARNEAVKAQREAEEANRAKSAMLANTSHELRTPLNAILGFSEMIDRELLGPIGNTRYRQYAADIHSSGRHLLNLIDDLLDLSKIESGKTELSPEWLDIRQISAEVCRMVDAKAREKEQQIATLFDPAVTHVLADKRALSQILVNLVTNASKFSGSGETVTVRWALEPDGKLLMAVDDNGVGIDPADVERLVKPFEQAEKGADKPREGWGLGLAMVVSLVQMHEGKFNLAPRSRGGTSATVLFPAERAAAMDENVSLANAS